MNWLDIFCFTTVARTGSFSVTARELMISQQAVSRHIRTLEEELGFPLLLRDYQSVRLTKAGEQMLRYFGQRERLYDEYMESLGAGREPEGLRIGLSQWLGCPARFREALSRWRQAHPDIQVLAYDLNAQELTAALEAGSIDLLLTTEYTAGHLAAGWEKTVLWEEPVYLIGSREGRYSQDAMPLYPYMANFAGEDGEDGVRARVGRICRKIGVQPRRVEVYADIGTVCLNVLVKNGLTLGIRTEPVEKNDAFSLHDTGLTATVVLCRPYHGKNRAAVDFASHFQEGGDVL